MIDTKRALERRPRAEAVPAEDVTILDPYPRVEIPDPPDSPGIYVHIEHMHVTQPAAPATRVIERVIDRPRPRARRRRRRMSPAMRAFLTPIVILLLAIAAVAIAHAVLADPVAFTDHVRSVGR